jgi:hypothetical protein
MNRLRIEGRAGAFARPGDWGAEDRFKSEQLLLELRTKLYYGERS